MSHYGNQMPQVGDLYVSETQGRLHILVSYEVAYKDRVDFHKYYDVKLKRLDDGATTSWTRCTISNFNRKYKPIQPNPQA